MAEIAQQGSLMERWSLKCQTTQWVSSFLQKQGGSVSSQQTRKEEKDVIGCCFYYFRSLLLFFLFTHPGSGMQTYSPSFSQWFFLACCLAVFQDGRGCPILSELSLGKKSECLLAKPQVWDPGYLSLIPVSAEGIHGSLGQRCIALLCFSAPS